MWSKGIQIKQKLKVKRLNPQKQPSDMIGQLNKYRPQRRPDPYSKATPQHRSKTLQNLDEPRFGSRQNALHDSQVMNEASILVEKYSRESQNRDLHQIPSESAHNKNTISNEFIPLLPRFNSKVQKTQAGQHQKANSIQKPLTIQRNEYQLKKSNQKSLVMQSQPQKSKEQGSRNSYAAKYNTTEFKQNMEQKNMGDLRERDIETLTMHELATSIHQAIGRPQEPPQFKFGGNRPDILSTNRSSITSPMNQKMNQTATSRFKDVGVRNSLAMNQNISKQRGSLPQNQPQNTTHDQSTAQGSVRGSTITGGRNSSTIQQDKTSIKRSSLKEVWPLIGHALEQVDSQASGLNPIMGRNGSKTLTTSRQVGSRTAKKGNYLAGDSFLPALRVFSPTKRAQIPSNSENLVSYKQDLAKQRQQSIDSDEAIDTKRRAYEINANKEKIAKVDTRSLKDKQQSILMRAKIHQPTLKRQIDTSKRSRVNGWLIKEVEDKNLAFEKKLKDEAKKKEEKAAKSKTEKGANGVASPPRQKEDWESSSDEKYDPLAESEKSDDADIDPETGEAKVSAFSVVRQIMKLKKKADLRAEAEQKLKEQGVRALNLKNYPKFSGPDHTKHYLDLNDPAILRQITCTWTEQEYKELREWMQDREDERNRPMMEIQECINKIWENERRELEMDSNLKKQERNMPYQEQLGDYKPVYQRQKSFIDDDDIIEKKVWQETTVDELLTSNKEEYQSKQDNKKSMLVPNKLIRISDHAYNLVNGIIWEDVKGGKISREVLRKGEFKHLMSLGVRKKLADQIRNEKEEKDLGLNKVYGHSDAPEHIKTDKYEQMTFGLFEKSKTKEDFYSVAKNVQGGRTLESLGISQHEAYKRFFLACNKLNESPLPIFNKQRDKLISIVGQYIREGLAQAMAEVFECRDLTFYDPIPEVEGVPISPKKKAEDFIEIEEINLDDNGIKDVGFSLILRALATQKNVHSISYVNNELGLKSIGALQHICSSSSKIELKELRLTNLKVTKNDLNELIKALGGPGCVLNRIRLSYVEISDFVTMKNLNTMVLQMPQLVELNVKHSNLSGVLFCNLIEILLNCANLANLNISYNTVPSEKEKRDDFLENLVKLIEESSKITDIDLSHLNLKFDVVKLMWPLARSRTLQSIHLSDNQISQHLYQNLLMAFKVKQDAETGDLQSIATAVKDPKISQLTSMEQLRMMQRVEQMPNMSHHHKDQQNHQNQMMKNSKGIEKLAAEQTDAKKIQTYEDATAQIANSEHLREMTESQKYMQSQTGQGLGRTELSLQPLVISRKLGHDELIFNEGDNKNTAFESAASRKWVKMPKNECWICDKWKYTVIFFDRRQARQFYTKVTDEEKIRQLEKDYDLNEEDLFLVQSNKAPLIMGSVTQNSVASMCDVNLFNFFLDKNEILDELKEKGEEALQAVLNYSQGIQTEFGKDLSEMAVQDWVKRFYDKLPYYKNQKDVLICSFPDAEYVKKLKRAENFTDEELEKRQRQAREEIFVYAGFMPVGKHSIIIKDKKTGDVWTRNIVVDIRKSHIKDHFAEDQYKVKAIRRFTSISGVHMIDLDNSVFMNFKRYTKANIEECFESDMKGSNLGKIIEDESEVQMCSEILLANYVNFCQYFHELSASLPGNFFPLVSLNHLDKILAQMSECNEEESVVIRDQIVKEYKEMKPELEKDKNLLLNRTAFAEVLLLTIKALYFSKQGSDFNMSQNLSIMLHHKLDSQLKTKDSLEQVTNSLEYFRNKYVWNETVNNIFEANLEHLMDIFMQHAQTTVSWQEIHERVEPIINGQKAEKAKKIPAKPPTDPEWKLRENKPFKHLASKPTKLLPPEYAWLKRISLEDAFAKIINSNKGFTIFSAYRLLQGVGFVKDDPNVKIQFDLAQMTVIDESTSSDEYSDMEFVEFLEFLVRIAFLKYKEDPVAQDQPIWDKLALLLRDLMTLFNKVYMEVDHIPDEEEVGLDLAKISKTQLKKMKTSLTSKDIAEFGSYFMSKPKTVIY